LTSFSAIPLRYSRWALAAGAGILLALSFPQTGIAGFAWIAPGLMLLAALGTRGWESFRIGYVAGLASYLASLRWLLLIPVTGFPILGWAALSAFLALYTATWVWLVLNISNFKFQIPESDIAAGRWLGAVHAIASWPWGLRAAWCLVCAASWAGLEMVITRLFGGFPWDLLGVSQQRMVPLLQMASVTGVYGVSFLVAWGSVSLLCAGAIVARGARSNSAWLAEVILPLAAIFALFFAGFHKISRSPDSSRQLKVALIQPSIPQTLIWNPDKNEERFQDLLRISESALSSGGADLLVWPEAAIPRMLAYDSEIFNAVTNLAIKHHVWMIVGSDDAEVTKTSTNFYNSSFLVSPAGQLVQRYRKRSLVIFGEYIPLERWLPFIRWFTPIQGGFTPGDRPEPFRLPDLGAQVSVLICFEDTFPQLGRESVGPDTDFLVNITNDGWFGEGAAQWQHAATAEFRAIENGLPLVRCTNTGLTCWFDAFGRMRQAFRDTTGSIYGPGFLLVNIPLLNPAQPRLPTFYHEHGDVFGWSCAVIAALAVTRRSRGKHRPGS
jgi:apolipoprotein N-acyltransferase